MPSRQFWSPSGILTVFLFANLVAFVTAAGTTTTSSTATSSSTSSAQSSTSTPTVHVVTVGSNGDNSYHPNVTYANPGDIVSFQFWPTNHSVVRGEYAGSEACGASGCNPCIPYELIHPGAPGFFFSKNFLVQSIPGPSNLALQSYNITINDTSPIWFYCTAIDSCTPNGMVGAINPTNGTTIDKQVTAAMSAKLMLVPGQSWPAEGTQPGAANATNTAAAPSSTSSSGSSNVTHNHKLSGGAIAGISVAAAAVVLLCAALCYFIGRSNSYKDILKHQNKSDGVPSHVGDGTSGPWSPAPMSPSVPAGWDGRFSGQTQYSHLTHPSGSPGTLVGYNRLTGAPEYAAEAPSEALNEKDRSPPPPFAESTQETAYELPGEQPPVAEVGPYK